MKPVRKQRGAIIVLIAAAMVALVGMAGLAIDSGHMMLNNTRLQNTVDAAALAGAKMMDLTSGDQVVSENAARAISTTMQADQETLSSTINSAILRVTVEFSATLNPFVPNTAPGDYVRVRATGFNLGQGLSSIVGFGDKEVSASAVAGPSPTINTACNIVPDDDLRGARVRRRRAIFLAMRLAS